MYRFRLPAIAHKIVWTYEGLSKFIDGGQSNTTRKVSRKVGTTVNVYRQIDPAGIARDDTPPINVRLYDTVIAVVHVDNEVWVPWSVDDFGSQATTAWLQLIVPVFVERVDGRYNVAGRTFTA